MVNEVTDRWRSGRTHSGHRCIYLYHRTSTSRGITYAYDPADLDDHAKRGTIDPLEYAEGLKMITELGLKMLHESHVVKVSSPVHSNEKRYVWPRDVTCTGNGKGCGHHRV